MSRSPGGPTQEEALVLHQRLLAQDPTASNDLAFAYLEELVAWLSENNPRLAEDLCLDAAERAILSLIRQPDTYTPEKGSLLPYLRMSASGDLRNLLRDERRHTTGRKSLEAVELSPDAGKYLGRDEDPAFRLRLAEEQHGIRDAIPDRVRQELSELDLQVLELILQGERRTAVFAVLYQLTDLPVEEQREVVKRHKNRLKMMLKRSRGKP